MQKIIEELWLGNVCPQTDCRSNLNETKKLMEYLSRHHDEFFQTMTDEQKEIFKKFDDSWSEYLSISEAEIFEYSFKLGARMILEILLEKAS